MPFSIESVAGGGIARRDDRMVDVSVTLPGDGDRWIMGELRLKVGQRIP